MALFATAFQMSSRVDEDRFDMAHRNDAGVRDHRGLGSGRYGHLYKAVLRRNMASHPGAAGPFETHALRLAGPRRYYRMTRGADESASNRRMMRFAQKLVLVMIKWPLEQMPDGESPPHLWDYMLSYCAD
jgi:hypothetical protein